MRSTCIHVYMPECVYWAYCVYTCIHIYMYTWHIPVYMYVLGISRVISMYCVCYVQWDAIYTVCIHKYKCIHNTCPYICTGHIAWIHVYKYCDSQTHCDCDMYTCIHNTVTCIHVLWLHMYTRDMPSTYIRACVMYICIHVYMYGDSKNQSDG